MNRKMSGEAENLPAEPPEKRDNRSPWLLRGSVYRGRVFRRFYNRPKGVLKAAVTVGEELSHSVEGGLGKAEDLPDVPDRRPGAVSNQVRHHGRPVPAVLPVHVGNNLFPTAVFDVEVDIRWLRALFG